MNKRSLFLWIAQAALAIFYGAAGFAKSTQPISALAAMMVWPGDVPTYLVRFIGVSELAGAVGLILPGVTGVAPWLTPLAAAGLLIIQTLAIPFHIWRGEWFVLPLNIALATISVFIIWGRTKSEPSKTLTAHGARANT